MCRVVRQLGCKSVELVEPKYWPTLKKYGFVCALAGSHWFDKGMNNPAYEEEGLAKMRQAIDETGFTGYIGHEFIPTRDPLEGLSEAVALCDV